MESNHFLAGAAKVDITPPMGTIVGVDFISHYARFIHDPLYAKALVFKSQNTLIALVVVDICIMDTDLMNDIKQGIQIRTGIDPEHVLLASNHNHASGNVVGLLASAVDIAYRSKLPELLVKAVELACANLEPAKIASGSVDVPDFVRCRRYLMKDGYVARNPITGNTDEVKTNPIGAEEYIEAPAGPTDPGLSFLAIKGLDDRWIGLLGNYSLHYVGDWHVDSITADYFGEFSRQIQEKLGADEAFVGIMSNGTSGDINIWDFMNPDRFPKGDYEKTRLIGGHLAQKVQEALYKLDWQEEPGIAVAYSTLELAIRKPSPQELKNASRIFIENDFEIKSFDEEGMERIYAREQLLLNEYPDTVPIPVQAIRLGSLLIGALPGEFFAETGLLLKKGVPGNNYFSLNLANAYGGYIPPAHEMKRGGYETWRARSSFLEPGAEKMIREEMLNLTLKLTL